MKKEIDLWDLNSTIYNLSNLSSGGGIFIFICLFRLKIKRNDKIKNLLSEHSLHFIIGNSFPLTAKYLKYRTRLFLNYFRVIVDKSCDFAILSRFVIFN